jgi:hypothetical protein
MKEDATIPYFGSSGIKAAGEVTDNDADSPVSQKDAGFFTRTASRSRMSSIRVGRASQQQDKTLEARFYPAVCRGRDCFRPGAQKRRSLYSAGP